MNNVMEEKHFSSANRKKRIKSKCSLTTQSFKKHLLACMSSYSAITESLGLVLDGVNKMRVSEPDEERQTDRERKGEKENSEG